MMQVCALLLTLSLLLPSAQAQSFLKLSTTTSTDNSGLLSVINQAFTEHSGIRVAVIAVGTGQALKLGANGDVDLALVHAPEAELSYIESGDFIDRRYVMYNDFVLVGPESDPAYVRSATTISEAMQKIAGSGARFVSRGDDSGTHKKELQLWDKAGIKPAGRWYIQAGQGMGAVLKIADEMQGYALTDRGTQIAFADKMSLQQLYEGGNELANPYHIMAVNPERHAHADYANALRYIEFITSEAGRTLIDNFSINGQPLFFSEPLVAATD
ncbi:MAG: substrate-binding domain-containing protein [Methylophaga sp.]|nr:substrate-binding domain-containing protein [Methylophaga sp.]